GDQILNARSFEKQGYSMVMEEEEITEASLLEAIHRLYADRQTYADAMANSKRTDSIRQIVNLIEQCAAR
ncbi:MAG: UDP-N-acetylglucosamine--N-acetylmuramyl-(pentapeptide) pyrophosphoryl-undecaprenol N-acetylglucosamine transferase, partial [Lachnospiraceae bacterium]|nr:UDP-N-acetylglucosamine--N-acetylmuramyl-(pentapeptide) pyrophosphoryl-undecaprenol N-acetylglucosamine transferase [Lachnospiraceae bacterium]